MDWTRGRTIGHGGSATVSTATSRLSGEVFAVKSAEVSRSEPLRREQGILSKLSCNNIIGYRGCEISVENGREIFNLMLDYAADGTVRDAINREGGRLGEAAIRRYTNGIVRGLEYLHSRGIVHCDIKGSNVLLRENEAKIADFGCAKGVEEAAAMIGGTPMFMAPEVARGEEQGFAADIWALGCTVIEMSTGGSPWPNEAATLHRIAFSGEAPQFPGFLSEVGKDFLGRCLRVDPRERWSAKELLKHPFFDEFRRITDSPTSVLEQGIWSSVEEEYFSDDQSEGSLGEILDCPMKRVQELSTDGAMGNWDWRERWITVREK